MGDDRVLAILRETRYSNPEQVLEAMTKAVEQHRNGNDPNDDLTMMCINVK